MGRHLLLSLVLTLAACRFACATVIFDTFTGPDLGGYSSPDQGITSQITALADVPITNISVLNSMFAPGHLKFVIYSHPAHASLYVSPEISVPDDPGRELTWKTSPSFNFLLEAGQSYDIGYVHDVSVLDPTDAVSESYGGLQSDRSISIVDHYASAAFERHFITGWDSAVRLHSVPEPSGFILITPGLMWLSGQRRRR